MRWLYTISVIAYTLSIRIASLFNPKARAWVKGRKKIFERLSQVNKGSQKLVWFHCASLGEFEQGRPLIEQLKKERPGVIIALSFFSPSGYEVRKDYAFADHIFYLPSDTPGHARRLITILKPDAAIFIKYEFWYNYLAELSRQRVPLYLVSGLFRPGHIFFKANGQWFRRQLKAFTHFFVQDEASGHLLGTAGFTNVTVSGDTRFDRVYAIAAERKKISVAEDFCKGKKVLVCGSTWEADEELMGDGTWLDGWKLIIAPHEIHEKHLASIEKRFALRGCVRYSRAAEQNVTGAQVLIVDNIGMLAQLYGYGDMAYVGGGFGDGIHSILEAAVYGIPVLFGPRHEKFVEAGELIAQGGGFCITGAGDLLSTFRLLNNDALIFKMASLASRNYVISKKGATEKVLRETGL
jgi:3-deoxy-D-manno-octulosonic-acid transferase